MGPIRILFINLAVEDRESALKKIDGYNKRWLIEEYHKCLKTGCKIEKRQMRSSQGLLALLGFLSIVTVRLLRLKTISREKQGCLAGEKIPQSLITILCSYYHLSTAGLTVQEFWHHLTRLGGFIGRHSYGEPGRQTLWKGRECLQYMSYEASLTK